MDGMITGRLLEQEIPQRQVDLGYVRRTCETCGREWIGPNVCGQGSCRGVTFSERYVGPFTSSKPTTKPTANDVDLTTLHQLRAALVAVDQRLSDADKAARALVNRSDGDFFAFGRIQEVLALMATGGDFAINVRNPLRAVGIRQLVHALVGEIDRAIQQYEEMKA